MPSLNMVGAALVGTVLFSVSPALAAANLLTNGSFESYNSSSSSFTGWTNGGTLGSNPAQYANQQPTDGKTAGVFGDVVTPDPVTSSPDSAGTHAAYFVSDGANQTLSQTIALFIGQTYEVGFDLFKTASGAGNPGGYTISGKIGDVAVTTATSANMMTASWTHYAARFVAATTSATFVFNYISDSGYSADVMADLVYVTSVPEPASFALFGTALVGLALHRRYKSNQA